MGRLPVGSQRRIADAEEEGRAIQEGRGGERREGSGAWPDGREVAVRTLLDGRVVWPTIYLTEALPYTALPSAPRCITDRGGRWTSEV